MNISNVLTMMYIAWSPPGASHSWVSRSSPPRFPGPSDRVPGILSSMTCVACILVTSGRSDKVSDNSDCCPVPRTCLCISGDLSLAFQLLHCSGMSSARPVYKNATLMITKRIHGRQFRLRQGSRQFRRRVLDATKGPGSYWSELPENCRSSRNRFSDS